MSDSVSICVDDIPHPGKSVQSLLFTKFRSGLGVVEEGGGRLPGVFLNIPFVKSGYRQPRSPSGMTTGKATATARAKAKSKGKSKGSKGKSKGKSRSSACGEG